MTTPVEALVASYEDLLQELRKQLSREQEQVRLLVLEGAKNRDTIRRLVA